MSYPEAFEALQRGDFQAAAPLLEKLAQENDYASDIVNNAYTLALYRIGEKERLADVAFRVGDSLRGSDPGAAMDYFQRAISAGLDAPRVRQIGEMFEGWAAPRSTFRLEQPVTEVVHVVGCLLSGHSTTSYVKMLSASLSQCGVESSIFTTESTAFWFFNPEKSPLSNDVDIAGKNTIASVEGDFVERAERIADNIRASGIPVVFYHGGLSEQITTLVAALRPAPVQIQVSRDSAMDADLFDGAIHVFKKAPQQTHDPVRPTEWIPWPSDIEDRLQALEPVARKSLGFESVGTLSATFDDLDKVAGTGYLNALGEILKRFPDHCHIFAGAGNVRSIRAYLHGEGVLPRVRFMGSMGDIAPLLSTVDIVLAPFPDFSERFILDAMGAAKPVVVLGQPSDSPGGAGAQLVGLPELIARNELQYAEVADRVIRNATLRTQLSSAIRDRFLAEFCPTTLGSRYVEFLHRF